MLTALVLCLMFFRSTHTLWYLDKECTAHNCQPECVKPEHNNHRIQDCNNVTPKAYSSFSSGHNRKYLDTHLSIMSTIWIAINPLLLIVWCLSVSCNWIHRRATSISIAQAIHNNISTMHGGYSLCSPSLLLSPLSIRYFHWSHIVRARLCSLQQ